VHSAAAAHRKIDGITATITQDKKECAPRYSVVPHLAKIVESLIWDHRGNAARRDNEQDCYEKRPEGYLGISVNFI
jgi:hypothetical protein